MALNILSLDSTATTAAVAVCRDEKLICSFTVNNGNTHSEILLPLVESALNYAKLTIDNIDLAVCSKGPGSFTGVRIGAATIKGLTFGKNIPCVGVSTLEALAYNLIFVPEGSIVCPVMNARRSQLYNALFEIKNGTPVRLKSDRVITTCELDEELFAEYGERPIYFCGDGYDIALGSLKKAKAAEVPEVMRYQNGYSVALCGLKLYKDGDFTDDRGLNPTYLRPSQAERELKERLSNT